MLSAIIFIFHYWLLHAFFKCFFQPSKKRGPEKILIWSIFLICQLVIGNIIWQPLLLFLANSLLTVFLCLFLFNAEIKKVLFLSFASCSIGMMSEILVAVTLQALGPAPEDTVVVGTIISKVILLFLVHTISIFQYRHSHNSPSLLQWILLFGITLASIICIYTLFYFNQLSSSALFDKLSLACILLLFLINLSFFVFDNKLAHATNIEIENIVMAQQVKHYEELRANRENHIVLFNREKHNLKNQLLAIRAYAKTNDVHSIITFVNHLMDEPDFGLIPFSASSNIIFDTIICNKITLANAHNISYTWNIDIPAVLPFKDIDLCILLGNTIDNAFDAAINCALASKHIHIDAKYKHNCLYLSVVNSFSHPLNKIDTNTLLTTKKHSDSHGFGLPSVKNIVNKYDGTISFDNSDDEFTLKILLCPNISYKEIDM